MMSTIAYNIRYEVNCPRCNYANVKAFTKSCKPGKRTVFCAKCKERFTFDVELVQQLWIHDVKHQPYTSDEHKYVKFKGK